MASKYPLKVNVCRQCGQCFWSSRTDARYCSQKCRLRYKRTARNRVLLATVFEIATKQALDAAR